VRSKEHNLVIPCHIAESAYTVMLNLFGHLTGCITRGEESVHSR